MKEPVQNAEPEKEKIMIGPLEKGVSNEDDNIVTKAPLEFPSEQLWTLRKDQPKKAYLEGDKNKKVPLESLSESSKMRKEKPTNPN